MNLSGCPTEASYTERFYQIIQQLVPSVSQLSPPDYPSIYLLFVFGITTKVTAPHPPFLQSYYLGMTLQNMNQMRLVPKKDYVANRLVSGALQLARNTSLFLDESRLEQGQLDTTGEALRRGRGGGANAVDSIEPALNGLCVLCVSVAQVCVTSRRWGT